MLYLFSKGDYDSMRTETVNFSREEYFNGYQRDRNVEKIGKSLNLS